MTGYHVTRRAVINSILENGLLVNSPSDYGENGDIPGVYLFKTFEDMQIALLNWMGERIEEWEEENNACFDEIGIEVDLTGMEDLLINSVDYEWIAVDNIAPDKIIRLVEV